MQSQRSQMSKNGSPCVSVCLPVFNGARHLSAAIESVLCQSLEDFELLIADDGSSDQSVEIALDYASKDNRIIFSRNQKRQGLFGNYNTCMKEARGKYIKTFAQDDILHKDALAKMSSVLDQDQKVVLASSARNVIDGEGNLTELKQPMKEDMRLAGRDVITFNLISLNNWVGEPSTVMFRSEFAGSGFDPSYYHYGDIEYWFRILMKGDYYYFAGPLASFRRHALSQTDKNHKELYFALDVLRLSLSYRHMLEDIEPESVLKKRLAEKLALEHGHLESSLGAEELFKSYQAAFMQSSLNDSLQIAFNRETAIDHERARAESAGFRLLASLSLSSVSSLIAELDHEKRCRKDEHELFLSEVEKMKRSIYYKLANPLRRVKALISGKDAASK